MIRHIKLIRNIGTFDSDNSAASLDLKRLALIYADNGRGKTTVAAVLRSLTSGEQLPIAERRRLGSEHPPHVVLDCEGESSNAVFQSGQWNRTLPHLKIFDDVFVDENVHSGLDVASHHRQNLHELILGDQGVALNRALQRLVSRITEHNAKLEERSKAIPEPERWGLSVDDFCSLPAQPDIDVQIAEAERVYMAARNQDAVQSTPLFQQIELPEFDIEAIGQTLSTNLQDLDKAAESQVKAHLLNLGIGGESWISDGMERLTQGGDGTCPFCGQEVAGLELVAHYRAYFSEGYARLKQDVADMIVSVDRIHADGTQAAFERAVGTAKQTGQFWANYSDVPAIEIDTAFIAVDWNAAWKTTSELLQAKQASPLEQHQLLDSEISLLTKFNAHRNQIKLVNTMLAGCNDTLQELKNKAEATSLEDLGANLARLKATKARHSDAIAPLCAVYLQEKENKAQTEDLRAAQRNALDDYRTNVFPTLQDGVNAYLERFNAGFRIDSLAPTNIGGGSGSTCTYNVVINDTPIAVRNANSPEGVPSFRNSLSAGDRNTLALALFFSSIDQNPNLAETVVVIDDPMSSLDDHRSLTTVQAVRNLVGRAKQVIVLSHNKAFLCQIWKGADHKECRSLEIVQVGDSSSIRSWDVNQDAITEHDQRHFLLHGYASNQSGNRKEVATAIRPHLEGFLRVACPSDFPPGKLLGLFIGDCRQRLGNPDEIINERAMQELDEILEYGNMFHHATNPAWETEGINPTQLLVLQRRFKEGCPRRHEARLGAWHESGWPVRYCPAYPPATAATLQVRTVPGAASHALPGTLGAGLSGASFPPQACCRLRRKAPPSRHRATW